MKNFNWKDLLRQHSLFESLDPKEVERIIAQLLDDKVSDEREYAEGNIIVREGEPGASVFLVGRGSVQVILEGDNGAGTPISALRQGEFFGEMALLEKKPRAATVKARESCILLEINGQEFLKLLDEHKDVESKMLLKLSERLRHANDQVLAGRMRGVDDKLEAIKVKHEAELKAVDAQLKAALAIFEQTKLRTNEIISSAEQSRAQRTWVFGSVMAAISIAAAIGAAFGLKEIMDIKKYADQAERAMQRVTVINAEIDKVRPDVLGYRTLSELLNGILRAQQADFRNDLLHSSNQQILVTYDRLRELHGNLSWFLTDIEIAMNAQPGRDYGQILQAILDNKPRPEDRFFALYLLLTNNILTDRMQNFETMLQEFENYKRTEGPFTKPIDPTTLGSVFEQKPEKRQLFNRVVKVLPKR